MKRLITIMMLMFMAVSCFSATQWIKGLTQVVDIDTLTSADTVVTIGLTVNADSLPGGNRPDIINVFIHINDMTGTESPTNTATVRLQVYVDSTYIDIYKVDASSGDYGTSVLSVENMYYERMRFVVESNIGTVKVLYGLKRDW